MWITSLIGSIALCCFSARLLIQWLLSEKAHREVSPSIYWVFSLLGCYLYFAYGWLREDFAIIAGQLVSVYVYIWNLKVKGVWRRIPVALQWVLYMVPVFAMMTLIAHSGDFFKVFLTNPDNPVWMLVMGTVGNVIFSSRFLYQWYYSYRKGRSEMPLGFWLMALVGSLLIIFYGLLRHDWIQVLGQFNIFISIRSIWLIMASRGRKNG